MSVVRRETRHDRTKYFRQTWLPQLRAGNVNLQILPVFVDKAFAGEAALREAVRMIETAHELFEAADSDLQLCLTASDLDRALSTDRVAIVLALEGLRGIGEDLQLLSSMRRLGVRCASLVHFGRGVFADGSDQDAAGARLSTLGVEAVQELERLEVMIDVSHLGRTGLDHLLEISSNPLIATHSSAKAIHNHHRNLSDNHLTEIAARGGVIAVNVFAPYLHDSRDDIGIVVEHISHIASVAGTDAVALGPDFVSDVIDDTIPACSITTQVVAHRRFVAGLERPDGLPSLLDALTAAGFSRSDVEAIAGGNLRRFLAENLK